MARHRPGCGDRSNRCRQSSGVYSTTKWCQGQFSGQGSPDGRTPATPRVRTANHERKPRSRIPSVVAGADLFHQHGGQRFGGRVPVGRCPRGGIGTRSQVSRVRHQQHHVFPAPQEMLPDTILRATATIARTATMNARAWNSSRSCFW
jgi:hypothetical protein